MGKGKGDNAGGFSIHKLIINSYKFKKPYIIDPHNPTNNYAIESTHSSFNSN